MSQKRYWNTGDPFSAQKARDVQIGLHLKGVYLRYDVTVALPNAIDIGADGFALLPDGIAVSESAPIRLTQPVLSPIATDYTVTARHTENDRSGGAPVLYAIELGHLTNDDITNGIVLAWIHYTGGGNPFIQSMIELPPLVTAGTVPSGPAGIDVTGNYPDQLRVAGIRGTPVEDSVPAEGTALVVTGGEYVPTLLSSLTGSGIPSANFNVLGASTDYSPPTNYIDGFREFGVAAQVATIVISQEVAGVSGTTVVNLYKIDTLGNEVQITPTGSLSIPFTSGNLARVVSTTFVAGTNVLSVNDRLGVKVVSLQTGGSDVSVNVIVAAPSIPAPVIVEDDNHVTSSINGAVMGNVFTYVGSVYIPASIILASDSRVSLGAAIVTDSTQFQLRRATGGTVVYDVTYVGTPTTIAPAGNISIAASDFYEMWVRSPSGGTALLRGIHFVWQTLTGLSVNFATNVTNVGIVPIVAGGLYLTTGNLQGSTAVVMDAYGVGSPTAFLDIIRPDTLAVIATLQTSGVAGREAVALGAPLYLPVSDFYILHLRADAPTTSVGFYGMKAQVI